jgi:hypothetical protein
VSFPLYRGWALHDPLAWSQTQTAWGRSFRVDGIYSAVRGISHQLESDARFALPALPVYWALAWLCRRRVAFATLAAVSMLLLATTTVTLPLVFP